ncbi:MAG: tail fiber domain-containing protein [candidate division Zixibacteria bacterium]|nr:tail fiber domain-containing protein [candidate division Zixibacteria bacterium]
MKKLLILLALGAIVAFVLVFSGSSVTAAVPHLINYQGMLTDDAGDPITDTLNIEFKIYDSQTLGNLKWSETQTDVSIIDGLFNVVLGSVNPIDTLSFSENYWLEIKVGTEVMPTRLRFTSVGYAYRAEMADTADYALAAGGAGDNDWTFRVTDTADTTLITGGAWGIARYGNTLYGNGDSTHVNLGVACTTGTGGQNFKYCTVGGGYGNRASQTHATVGGGENNTASYTHATVGGGESNTASYSYATVGGGYQNTASGLFSAVGGGRNNNAGDNSATVGGGNFNTASFLFATVGGGENNTASGGYATVGGGQYSTASSGDNATVSGGVYNTASNSGATVSGGSGNTASGSYATVGGGAYNVASAYYSTVGGGKSDTVAGDYSFATGREVRITGDADYTFAFGRNFTTATPNAVIFYNSDAEIKIGIDTTSPGNIITVKKESTTDPIADSWTQYSSIRWKENINPIDNPLDKVLALQGVYFNWKESKKHDIGMIAEEVGKVVPEVVAYEENGVDAKSLDYARLTALLVEAIKEQQKEIELLKAKINTLETAKR